jgi:hypothetical protein
MYKIGVTIYYLGLLSVQDWHHSSVFNKELCRATRARARGILVYPVYFTPHAKSRTTNMFETRQEKFSVVKAMEALAIDTGSLTISNCDKCRFVCTSEECTNVSLEDELARSQKRVIALTKKNASLQQQNKRVKTTLESLLQGLAP